MNLQIVTIVLHYGWNILFVTNMGWGLVGTAICSGITGATNLAGLIIYLEYFATGDLRKSWFLMPDRDSFVGLLDYLKLGIPAMMMICLEWWTFEIQTFMASFISVEATATQVIMLNSIYVLFGFTLGVQFAGCALIGKAIGS